MVDSHLQVKSPAPSAPKSKILATGPPRQAGALKHQLEGRPDFNLLDPRNLIESQVSVSDAGGDYSLDVLFPADVACRRLFRTTPGQQLVSDITYIPTAEGGLYLALVVDRFSRSVFGWHLADSLHADLVCHALDHAHRTGLIGPQAIFHSDRGCPYTAALLRGQLARLGLRQSMSARGHCYDNAMAESVFAALKAEALPPEQPFASRALARSALFDYLETFYNRQRLHSSLGYRPPREFLDLYFQTHPLALH
ncbi:MAG: IS3 family transposase [Verrucomicrobiales bacterium]|nr:IS3 family transposase [Verrucomicrobiales bacterium]